MTRANFGKYNVGIWDESNVQTYLVERQKWHLFKQIVDDIARIDVWKLLHILPKREIREYDFDTALEREVAREVKHPEPLIAAQYPIKYYVEEGQEPYELSRGRLFFNAQIVYLKVAASDYIVTAGLDVTNQGASSAKPCDIPLESIVRKNYWGR